MLETKEASNFIAELMKEAESKRVLKLIEKNLKMGAYKYSSFLLMPHDWLCLFQSDYV